MGNQNWHTVCSNKMRKITSLGGQFPKSSERIMDEDEAWSRNTPGALTDRALNKHCPGARLELPPASAATD